MILRVWSNLPHFRETKFESGLNLVIADQAEDSAETESTNGLGKTTLIRIVQFCLGSDLARERVLNHPDLEGVIFGLDFEYDEEAYQISRSTSADGERISVSASFLESSDVEILDRTDNMVTISLSDWKRILTRRFLFDRRKSEGINEHGSPSFRDLCYYYMRIGKPAYSDPREVFRGQKGSQKQVSISYMLGLNWQSQKALHEKTAKRTEVSRAIKAIKSTEETQFDSIGDMEADRVVLEDSIAQRASEVEQFNVRADYAELEARLTSVDQQLHDLINENHSENQLLNHYLESSQDTPEADSARPLEILRDAGAVFKEDALKSIEQVSRFHEQVYRNRKVFLESEITKLRQTTRFRAADIRSLANKKSEILQILGASGALDSLIQLQRSLTEMNGELEGLKSRIDERKKFDRRKDDLTREISGNRTLLKNDLEDRRNAVDEAVALFARYTKHLYGTAAKLGIDVSNSGYRFNITIERDGSEGVEQMVIFCFDLMVATLRARRKSHFSTLIHDSTLFADVDPRQYGLALQLAKQEAERENFQYICCLNAGALPYGHLGELELDAHIRLRLTDDSERTRLLGMRLSARENS